MPDPSLGVWKTEAASPYAQHPTPPPSKSWWRCAESHGVTVPRATVVSILGWLQVPHRVCFQGRPQEHPKVLGRRVQGHGAALQCSPVNG